MRKTNIFMSKIVFRKILAALLTFQIVFGAVPLRAYDLSQTSARRSLGAPVTVALVPFGERRTVRINSMMESLARELKKKSGMRVLDRGKADEVLQYYLKYVNQTAQDDVVQQELTQARQELIGGNYSTAGRLLDGVEKRIRVKVDSGGSNEGLYQVYLLRAKIHHANGSSSGVQSEYDKLVLVHPDLDLDPNLYSHWERNALSKAKEKSAPRRTASVTVNAKPAGSEVFLNGVHRGITPMTLKDLPPGQHVIEVKTVHYAPFRQRIELRNGESQTVNAALARSDFEVPTEDVTIRPSLYKTDLEISRLISTLGYHMGVDKIVLVADKQEAGRDTLVYRAADTQLGGVQKQFQFSVTPGDATSMGPLVSSLRDEVRIDPLQDPAKHVDQSVGSLDLMHKKRKPIYKKPLFWILIAAGAGTGGALAAVVGAAGAATGGILIGF